MKPYCCSLLVFNQILDDDRFDLIIGFCFFQTLLNDDDDDSDGREIELHKKSDKN